MNTKVKKNTRDEDAPDETIHQDHLNNNIFLINSQVHIGDNKADDTFADQLKSIILDLIAKQPLVLVILLVIAIIMLLR